MPRFTRRLLPVLAIATAPGSACPASAAEPGLLFHVSADHGTTADFAANGRAAPTFDSEVTVVPDGAHGAALRCGNYQRLAWRAPGNIYAQRGTLSFFWRSRYPVGPTEFPLFRVGYADHSSWDMTWLRLDYNGHGVDAFVTDRDLARVRVSADVRPFPAPEQWMHVAFAWDETQGVRLFIDGRLAAEKPARAVLDAALDQFGPHSRIISPYQVQSDYNFTRGGDIDEIRIYDRMLDERAVAELAQGRPPALAPAAPRTLASRDVADEWRARYGWRGPADVALLPDAASVRIRKVEFTSAYDLKRWWWKACDGIRETTWPGVYNRSRRPGRHDYFTLPDWDCYVESGRAITFALPDEPWNHLEIQGGAAGRMVALPPDTPMETASAAPGGDVLLVRGHEERSSHKIPARRGGVIRWENNEPEDPLGEVAAYQIEPAAASTGGRQLEFGFSSPVRSDRMTGIVEVREFVRGRFPPDEQDMLVGQPVVSAAARTTRSGGPALPIVHLVIPDVWDDIEDGLDGIAVELPALAASGRAKVVPLNLSVKDPLWPLRAMADVNLGLRPGRPVTLWIDLRDRILPSGRALWLTLASADAAFTPASLAAAKVRLVFKPRAAAMSEHVQDRFTQARDAYAMLVEEHPKSDKLDLWNRFRGDLEDALRVDPRHRLARLYAVAAGLQPMAAELIPPLAPLPPDAPRWAARQVELLAHVKRFVNWYIDHRQVAYGDFGGGISDDVDLTNLWPGLALMGAEPEKVRDSLRRLLEAAYRNGMFTRGLPTIQADELHSYEEGINCLAQNLILNPGDPQLLERAMETTRGVEWITGVNAAGHRHIRTSYYSGTRLALEEPWGAQKPYSLLVCQVPELLVDYNGNPDARRVQLELATGLLAHQSHESSGHRLLTGIDFVSDREIEATRGVLPWHLYWAAWRWTGERKFLEPLLAGGLAAMTAINANALDELDLRADWLRRLEAGDVAAPTEVRRRDQRAPTPPANFRSTAFAHFAWQLTGDKARLADLYEQQIATCDSLEFINTEGSLWIDRVGVPTGDLQRARLGGVALLRGALFPGHRVSWQFEQPGDDERVALLVPDGTSEQFRIVAYNLTDHPIAARMTGADVAPGEWEFSAGTDSNDDDRAEGAPQSHQERFERGTSVRVVFPPKATWVIEARRVRAGTPYWERPDLGIAREDVTLTPHAVSVRIHNLGSVPSPTARLAVLDAAGAEIAQAAVPPLAAPLDLMPRSAVAEVTLPPGNRAAAVRVEIPGGVDEITQANNRVDLSR